MEEFNSEYVDSNPSRYSSSVIPAHPPEDGSALG